MPFASVQNLGDSKYGSPFDLVESRKYKTGSRSYKVYSREENANGL